MCDSAGGPATAPLRRSLGPGKQALEQDTREAFQRDGTTLCFRHENGTLEGADDEAGELLGIRVGRQLTPVDRRLQAVGDRCLVFREYRGDAKTNRLAGLA